MHGVGVWVGVGGGHRGGLCRARGAVRGVVVGQSQGDVWVLDEGCEGVRV